VLQSRSRGWSRKTLHHFGGAEAWAGTRYGSDFKSGVQHEQFLNKLHKLNHIIAFSIRNYYNLRYTEPEKK
jgi:hypothetical protein